MRHPCGTLGTLLAAGATRAELERIIAIDRQALKLGRAKLAGLSGREYDEEKKVRQISDLATNSATIHSTSSVVLTPQTG